MTLWFLLLLLLVSVHAAPDPACIAFHRHPRTVHSSDHCALALHSPKVALLFLTRGELPHEKLWRRWFEDLGSLAFSGCMVDRETDYFMKCTQERRADPISQQHLFSVYVHTDPDFPGYRQDNVFYGYELGNRVEAHWLDLSAAMFVLLRAAVHNPVNRYFVLLSEACVPIYPAAALYLQVVHEPRSRITAGCDNVPDFGEHSAPRRMLWDVEEYPTYNVTKSSQWFLLNRAHAELAMQHGDDSLLNLPDEWYLATLLRTFNKQNETTCDWQGATFTNWTLADDKHPLTYRAVDADQLRGMRLGSSDGAACDWEGALAQAADPGRFVRVTVWDLQEAPAAFEPMNATCPLFARKLAPEGQASHMAALWPEPAATPGAQ